MSVHRGKADLGGRLPKMTQSGRQSRSEAPPIGCYADKLANNAPVMD
jgi:hypothetical protein